MHLLCPYYIYFIPIYIGMFLITNLTIYININKLVYRYSYYIVPIIYLQPFEQLKNVIDALAKEWHL